MDYKNNVDFRKEVLTKLLNNIIQQEDEIINALYDDFKKPAFEAVLTETNYVITDLRNTIRNIKHWAKPKRVFPSLLNFPSTDYIYSEPFGNVLVISPWNYPFMLAMSPMVAAVAAGNYVVVKPSELTPKTGDIIAEIIRKTFDPNHVEVFLGGVEVAEKLLARRWDHIFFTGSVSVGKLVAQAAARHLTPVTLELGGKNPCIVDKSANLPLAAKRIVWGKFINAGQTCIAPDYILVHRNVKPQLVDLIKREIKNAYGGNVETSPDFARIINYKNWRRLNDMIIGTKILYGGISNEQNLYIAPTLIDEPEPNDAVMKEEIFGPLLPILGYDDEETLKKTISRFEKPLALYVFSDDKAFSKKIIETFSFGGGCINDTIIHFSNARLPFGGVGHSGSGAYHGKRSFDTFSHQKSIVKKANWLDVSLRYAPYEGKLKTIRNLLKWF